MNANVLFVDDEVEVLESLKLALRREPLHVLTATSTDAAFAELRRTTVDVVVSDERMPGMSGSEFLTHVRHQHPGTVRIMLTGQASLEGAIRAINEGQVFRFLTKPCPSDQIASAIRDGLMVRTLMHESSRLLALSNRQKEILDTLERRHPGITKIEVKDVEPVKLDVNDGDLAKLLERLRR